MDVFDFNGDGRISRTEDALGYIITQEDEKKVSGSYKATNHDKPQGNLFVIISGILILVIGFFMAGLVEFYLLKAVILFASVAVVLKIYKKAGVYIP